MVIVRRSWIHDNADGGLQATLGGDLEAVENISENNQGTASANGIAANGARLDGTDPARLVTRGNLVRRNGLRGISVRSYSHAVLRDDFVCGNGTASQNDGFALALLGRGGASLRRPRSAAWRRYRAPAAERSSSTRQAATSAPPSPRAERLRLQRAEPADHPRQPAQSRRDGGAGGGKLMGELRAQHALRRAPRARPRRLRAQRSGGRHHTGRRASVQRRVPRLAVDHASHASAGELVRIYGSGFDALSGNDVAGDCNAIAAANRCPPRRGNCVFVGGQPAQVVAVTPTMLVVRAPFTCVEPVQVAVRTRWTRGFARISFCLPDAPDEAARP